MRSRFGGLSFGRDHWHSEHDSPGWLFGNHYGGLGYAFGTRGDDVLQGTEHRDFIIGLSGDDIISAGDGNDWVKGGYGNDVLDGGAGSDKVLSGNGDDVATYVLAENVGTDACGRETHDFYDGGKGFDVLQLILTPEEMKNQDVQDEIAAYRAFLAEHANPCSANGPVFEFQSFDLTVRNFEDVEVVGGNTPPVAQPDSFTTTEDPGLPVTITTASVLANDSDADHDALTAIFVDDAAHAPMNGTLTFNADGSVSYMPNPDFFGTDGFNYVLSDGTDQVEGSITIDVTPVNDPPQLKDPANPPPVWEVTAGSKMETFNILDYYVPGPENEWPDQADSLQFVGAFSGSATIVDDKIQYDAPSLVGHTQIVYSVFDGVDGVTSALLDVNVVAPDDVII